ncbi:chromatin-remodeling complex subunit ies6 [Malassezia caprae]|uniref:Chromatin-remodeling complex subunit ies6 n=1 Tax=Malassezia caprae TaxID=1381934 RepID=A0AAF0E4A9_9BASI|nr:chromatin-remodeling complex subunit ies6 [Malassezia caprae]
MGDDSITSETLNVYDEKRPFKSEAYLQKSGANGAPVAPRRNKTLKQILNQERDMFLQQRMAGESATKRLKTDDAGASRQDAMEVDARKPSRSVPTYTSVQAPPSLLPAKKYCDITGLVGNYTDPKTRLRYHSVEVYDIIKGFLK